MKTRILLALFIILNFLSCSKESNEEETASFDFQVEVQNVTDRSATATWTKPQGSNISYQIFLNNELIEDNFSQTAYTFNGLSGETSYSGKIVATNGSQSTTVDFSFITNQYIPKIYEGDAYLNNQNEVDKFGSNNYDEIRYNLIIRGLEVYDLTPLKSIKVVHGDTKIQSLAIENLKGLESINSIGGKLFLYNNSNLKNLNELKSITQIIGNIEIFSNRSLEDINGLKNVKGFSGGLQIETTKIREIKILQDATHLKNLYIAFNRELEDISGIGNVVEIEEFLDIDFNEKLLSFNGLQSIKHINGYAYISSGVVTNLGLKSLESVTEKLTIFFIPGITNLDDLSNLKSFGNLEIVSNSSLTDFCGISTAVLNMNKPIDISYNPYNPTLQDFINGNCSK